MTILELKIYKEYIKNRLNKKSPTRRELVDKKIDIYIERKKLVQELKNVNEILNKNKIKYNEGISNKFLDSKITKQNETLTELLERLSKTSGFKYYLNESDIKTLIFKIVKNEYITEEIISYYGYENKKDKIFTK